MTAIMEHLGLLSKYLLQFQAEIAFFSYVVLSLGLLQNIIYILQIPLAALEILRNKYGQQDDSSWWLVTSDITIPISIIVPAYNEEVTIINTVVASLGIQYPSFELLVVNDGSKDDTLKVLIEKFGLEKTKRFYEDNLQHKEIKGIYCSSAYPNLIVIDKENGGRSDALNAGLDVSRHPLFCTLDADSLLDPSALLKTVQPFIEEPEKVVATGGTVRILNGCEFSNGVLKSVGLPRKLLPLFQVSEYLRAFLMGRLAWSRLGILTIISGAFAIFRRDMVIDVGGFTTKSIGEDFEMVMRLHRHCLATKREYEIRFIPEPVCWTEVPESLEVLRSQRIRWQQGGLEVFFKHSSMFMNPRYGRIGMLAYPLMFIFDVLGPVVELLGYILMPIFYFLDAISLDFILAFLCLFFVMGIFISTMSLVLEEMTLKRFSSARELLILQAAAILENLGYRQYNNIWRIVGWWRFLRKKQSWGDMKRVGTN